MPGQKQVEDALEKLVSQGILGIFVLLLAIVAFYLLKTLLKSKDDRIADQKLMAATLEKLTTASKEVALEMNRSALSLTLDNARSNEAVKSALASQERALDSLTKEVESLQQVAMLQNLARDLKKGG